MIGDVEITITRETLGGVQSGYGMPLIVGNTESVEYAEVTSLAEVVTAGFDSTSDVYKMAAAVLAQNPRIAKLGVVSFAVGVGSTLEDALSELAQTNSAWDFLLCPDHTVATVKELSVWANGAGKIYVTAPEVVDVEGMITLAGNADMKQDRTVLFYSNEPAKFPDAAWVGACAPAHPGSITWKFKTLSGVSPVPLTTTDVTALHTANVNTYIMKMGIPQTSEGKTATGGYIDEIRAIDWVTTKISERVQSLLSRSAKIPYDNRGIAMVVAELQSVMQEGVSTEVIATDSSGNGIWSVTAPNRADIAAATVASRILPDVRFNLTLAGAIHKVKIDGIVQI